MKHFMPILLTSCCTLLTSTCLASAKPSKLLQTQIVNASFDFIPKPEALLICEVKTDSGIGGTGNRVRTGGIGGTGHATSIPDIPNIPDVPTDVVQDVEIPDINVPNIMDGPFSGGAGVDVEIPEQP